MTQPTIRRALWACRMPLLSASLLVFSLACQVPETSGMKTKDEHSIIEAVPTSAVVADEGLPGSWFPLSSLAPAARAFEVGPQEDESVRGGLLLIPPWWGVNPAIRNVARAFAEKGYRVVVPDLYEGVVSTSPLSAELLLRGVEAKRAESILDAALAHLEKTAGANAASVLGVGAGGGAALETARRHDGLRLVVVDTATAMLSPENAEGIKAPLLLVVGAESAAFHADRLDAIAADLERLGVDFSYRRIMLSGNVLLDDHAPGYSVIAAEEAIDAIAEAIEQQRSEGS